MSFQIHALAAEQFEQYFAMTDAELEAHNAIKVVVRNYPGAPCRVSLTDAPAGEEVLLLNYRHQPADSPYQASHAIFVRPGVRQQVLEVDQVPELFGHRLMSLRAFNNQHLMLDAEAADGVQLKEAIEELFSNPQIEYIQLHYAKPGCFAAQVSRA